MIIRHLLALSLALASLGLSAQEAYPSRAVKVVVPWPAGGSNDLAARVITKSLSESLRQPFVVHNVAGAGGTIGADMVAKSPPDGYTLMIHSGTHVANAFLYPTLPYDTMKDFAVVGSVAAQVLGVAVNSESKAKTLGEFIAGAKAQPGRTTVATAGIGSGADVQTALLEQIAGVSFLRVPYRGGGPQVLAVMSGESEMGIVALSSIAPGVQSNKARLLAVLSPKRSDVFPTVPTLTEAGIKGFDFSAWIGVFAPAGTPEPIVAKLHMEISAALQRDDVRKSLSTHALDPLPMSRDEFNRRIASDHGTYRKIIESTSKSEK